MAKRGKPLSQVGALPYRVTTEGQVEVMVITSRRKGRFLFPKGWKMKGKSRTEAAAQEAMEEAGVIGTPLSKPIGRYRYRKRLGAAKTSVTVTVFPMRVRHEMKNWREQNDRKRSWVKPLEAAELIENPSLAKLVPNSGEPSAFPGIEGVQTSHEGRTTMAPKKLDDLFHETLKDIYYAERKILKALPKMAKGAQSPELKAAFEKHRDETEGHVERLQQVFEIFGKRAQGKTCPAIEGIIEEGEEILDDFKESPALDAGLVSAAQAVEHYEITRYGTLKRWAQELGMQDAAKLLDQTLAEEARTDEALTLLAETVANQKAKAA